MLQKSTECGIKNNPLRKNDISRERPNLNYSNLQHLLSKDIAWDSENFIHIFCWKQKLQQSKLKSAILQLNTRYYRKCYTENANKTDCMKLIWRDEWPTNSSDLNPLEYHVWDWDAMLDIPMLHAKTDQHLRGWRTLCKRSERTCLKA